MKPKSEYPPLLTREQLQGALGVKGLWGKCLSGILYGILGLKKINRIHASKQRGKGPEFSEGVLADLGIKYEILHEQLEHIPAEGGFITVSNHHFGAVDGLILNAVIGSRRPDYKLLTTYFLSLVGGLDGWLFPVNNFTRGESKSVEGIKAAFDHLGAGGSLGLFPAGEVATWQKKANRTALGGCHIVEDKPWADNMMKLVAKSGLPVIPVYFDGGNSRLFHILGCIHPVFRTLRLAREMVGAKGKTIKVRIGQPIPAAQLASFDIKALGRYLRSRTYALEAQCLPAPVAHLTDTSKQEGIAPAQDTEAVRAEIASLEDKAIFETGAYRAYLIDASDAPHLMKELYRLREITFRGVGEGTGLAEDTDAYDSYYRHLILWHVEDGQIAGSYRVGYGSEIMEAHGGPSGLYTSTLLKFGPDAPAILEKSMELGRSFIVAKYQQDVLPLKMLFAGLCVATTFGRSVDCCIGLVSVTALLPDFYKSLVVHFLERDMSLGDDVHFASPTTPFEKGFLRVNPDDLIQVPKGDIDAFDRIIYAISDGKFRLPVLLRKYFSCGAKLACINVDPDFSNSMDAMIVLRLHDFPENSIRSFVRSLPEDLQKKVLNQFYGYTD